VTCHEGAAGALVARVEVVAGAGRSQRPFRGIYLEATPEDLAVFNRTHPDVLEHTSRNTAYAEQVCGA